MRLKYLKPTMDEAKLWLKAQSKISLTCYPENAPLETRVPVKRYCNLQSQLAKTSKQRVFSYITSRALLPEISKDVFCLTYAKILKSSQALHSRVPLLAASCVTVSRCPARRIRWAAACMPQVAWSIPPYPESQSDPASADSSGQ